MPSACESPPSGRTLCPATVYAADPAPPPTAKIDPADAIAAIIDRHLAADWAARGIKPAAPADDAEFVRRVYLDLIGRAPKAAETRDFLDDPNPDKRTRARRAAADHAGPRGPLRVGHPRRVAAADAHQRPVRQRRLPVRELAPDPVPRQHPGRRGGPRAPHRAVHGQRPEPAVPVRAGEPAPTRTAQTLVGFYQANEAKAENIGAAVSRLFLGVKLECAQCHDHPFAPYTKDQFWEFAAFFAEIEPAAGQPARASSARSQPQSDKNRITIPNTDKTVVATFFDGTDPNWAPDRIAAAGTGRLADQPEEPVLREEPGEPDVGALLRLRHPRPGRRAGREQPAEPPGTARRTRQGVRRRRSSTTAS